MSPLFDEAVFSELRGEVGEDYILEILDGFWVDAGLSIERLAQGQQTRTIVRHEAHGIKSAAQLLGFSRLSRLAGALEAGATTLAAGQLNADILEFRRVFDQTRAVAPPVR